MYHPATSTLFSSGFFFLNIFLPGPSRALLSPDWFSLSCPYPRLFPIESGFDCTTEKKICHFIFQYNQERMCPAPVCPFGGNIAMLQRFNCANRVGGSQRQCRTWSCAIIKLQWFYLFFIQIDKISIFWLTTDNFHFRNLFSGALMFFFLIIGDFSKELLKQ